MKIGHTEINAETGEETFTERELTAAEIQARQAREAESAQELATAEAANAQKIAILQRLGLTEDELKTILS